MIAIRPKNSLRLVTAHHREDFGHDWFVQILHNRRWALFQASVGWNDSPSWPYVQVKSGGGSLLSVLLWAHRLTFDFGFLEHTWNWDYIKTLDLSEDSDS